MFKLRGIVIVWFCFALGAASSVAAESPRLASKLASLDWSVKASPNLSSHPPSPKELVRFVASIENGVTGDTLLGVEGGTYICSFGFADFRQSGNLSLIVGIGVVNRPSCRQIEVIDKTGAGFDLYQSGGSTGSGDDIPSKIKDLKHDGNVEFLLETGLGSLTDRCSAKWTSIYAWERDNYRNVSDRFPQYYRDRLGSLKKVLSRPSSPDSAGRSTGDMECLEAELGAIQRFLGISGTAGLDQALRLANSKDTAERDFATQLLGEIGTPEARRSLERLAADSEKAVSEDAKYALSKSAKGPIPVAPDSFQSLGSVNF